jgi:hypothetical protein
MVWMLSEHIQAMRVDVSRDSIEYESISGHQHNNKTKSFKLFTLFYLIAATCFSPHLGPSSSSLTKYIIVTRNRYDINAHTEGIHSTH